jgi:hypothetical protein
MCCGMSCVGGLGFWYMQDPTLGGILGPAASSAVSTPSDSTVTSTSTSTADPPAASVPTDKDVYIWHKGCAAHTSATKFTILSGNDTSAGTRQVQLGCKSAGKEDPGWSTMWRFEKAGSNLYYVKHVKSKKFLTAGNPPGLQAKIDDAATATKYTQLWYVGKGTDGITLSLSRSAVAKQTYKNRWLAWNNTFCDGNWTAHTKREGNDPWLNVEVDKTAEKQTLWGIKVPGDATKMNHSCK